MSKLLQDEHVLIAQVALGNREAYTRLYTQYVPKLYRFIYPFTQQSKVDTEEVIQEVFLKIWIRKETLIGLRSFESYLFKMAKNQVSDQRKKYQTINNMVSKLPPEQLTGSEELHENMVFSEYHKSALEAIEQLTPKRREIFMLRTNAEMSLDEIASNLQISRSAVKKQLYISIHNIKSYMQQKAEWPTFF